MPVDIRRYPKNWKEISNDIKNRAGHKCEFCGVPNYALIVRDLKDPFNFRIVKGMEIDAAILDGEKIIKIILTTAHLGVRKPDGTQGDKHDKMDCRPENLASLCQRCHLRLDIKEHMENAARTRENKKIEVGNILLPGI